MSRCRHYGPEGTGAHRRPHQQVSYALFRLRVVVECMRSAGLGGIGPLLDVDIEESATVMMANVWLCLPNG